MKLKTNLTHAIALVFLIFLFQSCSRENHEPNPQNESSFDMMAPSSVQEIPGKYIVVLKNAPDMRGRSAQMREKALSVLENKGLNDVVPEYVYSTAIQGFSAALNPAQLKKLLEEDAIEYIESDKIISLNLDYTPFGKENGKKPPKDDDPGNGGGDTTTPEPGGQDTGWGVMRVGGPVDATGKVAWIIDSGIEFDHPDLNVDANRSRVFVSKGNLTPEDQNGHGTHVAGIIAMKDNDIGGIGVAANATVISIRVLDRQGKGALSDIIAGVDHVAQNAQPGDVANMSLGGDISQSLDDAVNTAAATGIPFTIAAGNSRIDCSNVSPARAGGVNVYTLSAFSKFLSNGENYVWYDSVAGWYDVMWSWSNYGAPIDYSCPGVNIMSCGLNGTYLEATGTSMAAPHLAGILLTGTIGTDGEVEEDRDAPPYSTATGTAKDLVAIRQ